MTKFVRSTVDATIERNIITGMIVDSEFVRELLPILRLDLFKSPFTRMVAQWCKAYYLEYEEAPNRTIQNIYESHSERLEEEMSASISEFLDSISEEYERGVFNAAYVLSQAESYMKKRALDTLASDIKADLAADKVDEAELRRISFSEIVRPKSNVIDVFSVEAVDHAFSNREQDVLFTLPGDLGRMFHPICRGDFIGIMAPMKRGKTFFLIDWAIRAYLAGLKVLFFSLEMTQAKMDLRIYQNLCGAVVEDKNEFVNFDSKRQENTSDKIDKKTQIYSPRFDEDGDIYLVKDSKKILTQNMALRKIEAVRKHAHGGELRLVCKSGSVVNNKYIMDTIHIENARNGFIPDIIIGDYMDIYALEPDSPKDRRNAFDHTWKTSAAVATDMNCAYITATQGGRSAFKKDMEQEDVTEDIRKLAHVTRMIAINKGYDKSEEKEPESQDMINLKKRYSFRCNMLAERHGYFDPEVKVRVLSQLSIGKPYLDSRFINPDVVEHM